MLGPGAFQEVDLYAAFDAVRTWGQTVLTNQNASELMALAIKHAVVEQGVTHLILPNEVQEIAAKEPLPKTPREGRISTTEITPPQAELESALALILRPSVRPSMR